MYKHDTDGLRAPAHPHPRAAAAELASESRARETSSSFGGAQGPLELPPAIRPPDPRADAGPFNSAPGAAAPAPLLPPGRPDGSSMQILDGKIRASGAALKVEWPKCLKTRAMRDAAAQVLRNRLLGGNVTSVTLRMWENPPEAVELLDVLIQWQQQLLARSGRGGTVPRLYLYDCGLSDNSAAPLLRFAQYFAEMEQFHFSDNRVSSAFVVQLLKVFLDHRRPQLPPLEAHFYRCGLDVEYVLNSFHPADVSSSGRSRIYVKNFAQQGVRRADAPARPPAPRATTVPAPPGPPSVGVTGKGAAHLPPARRVDDEELARRMVAVLREFGPLRVEELSGRLYCSVAPVLSNLARHHNIRLEQAVPFGKSMVYLRSG